MNDLEKHVNRLFKGYVESAQIRELKDEILSNLEAKVTDLTNDGIAYHQAVKLATQNIDSIQMLIGDHKDVFTNKYKTEMLQYGLLYVIISWIVTIPMSIVGMGKLLSTVLLISLFIIGILFLLFSSMKDEAFINKVSRFNLKSAFLYKKIVWNIWILFIVVCSISTIGMQFGSDIWIGRSIDINGPYQFMILVISLVLPVISIIIPLLFSKAVKLIQKYEVGG
ncbi:permease prefix domain 1-containing protein [Cytobacillus sp. Hm23]